jgi:hypothetical protein
MIEGEVGRDRLSESDKATVQLRQWERWVHQGEGIVASYICRDLSRDMRS